MLVCLCRGKDDDGCGACRPRQLRLRRKCQPVVEHDTDERAPALSAGAICEQRVVREGRACAHEDRVGLVALIANGYRALAYVLIAVYVVPLLTIGLWRLWKRDQPVWGTP